MRSIVIFKVEEINGKRVKTTLRSIKPSASWKGWTRRGDIINSEARNLARALEPTFTGYFLA